MFCYLFSLLEFTQMNSSCCQTTHLPVHERKEACVGEELPGWEGQPDPVAPDPAQGRKESRRQPLTGILGNTGRKARPEVSCVLQGRLNFSLSSFITTIKITA